MYSISSIKFANFFNIFSYIFIHTFFNEIKSPCKLKIGEENNSSLPSIFLSLVESHGRGIISWIICNEIEERIQWRRRKRRRQLAFSREELKKLNSALELNSLFRKHAPFLLPSSSHSSWIDLLVGEIFQNILRTCFDSVSATMEFKARIKALSIKRFSSKLLTIILIIDNG